MNQDYYLDCNYFNGPSSQYGGRSGNSYCPDPTMSYFGISSSDERVHPHHTKAPRKVSMQSMASVASSSSSGSSVSSSSSGAERKVLALDFVPGPYDVICARGAPAAKHPGNLRFRQLIKECLPKYSEATNKLDKSLIVTSIVDAVRDYSPNGGFVKEIEDGVWVEVGDAVAREKIGQCIRDQLHDKYKSSTKSKKPRRLQLREMKKKDRKPSQSKKVHKPPKKDDDKDIDAMNPIEILSKPDPPARSSLDEEDDFSLTNVFYNALIGDGLSLL